MVDPWSVTIISFRMELFYQIGGDRLCNDKQLKKSAKGWVQKY